MAISSGPVLPPAISIRRFDGFAQPQLQPRRQRRRGSIDLFLFRSVYDPKATQDVCLTNQEVNEVCLLILVLQCH
ncbi:unnamed protein product [Urochloa humidicola]